MKEKKELNLAVLIDADNIPYSNIKGIIEEITKFGVPSIKRIYGDWTRPTIAGWKPALLKHAITPIQQYSYTTGKNSTDSAMIIDAMDILYAGKVDGFCLVSSDSDFTRLAIRLRESGKFVVGFGEKKTPRPFIVACDKFVYIEIIGVSETIETPVTETNIPNTIEKIDKDTITFIKSTIEDLGDDDGWAFLAEIGNSLLKKKPDFDPRNYGFLKLTPLIKSLKQDFIVDERNVEKGHIKHVYVKIRK